MCSSGSFSPDWPLQGHQGINKTLAITFPVLYLPHPSESFGRRQGGRDGHQLAGTHCRQRCADVLSLQVRASLCCAYGYCTCCFIGEDTSALYSQCSFFICEQFFIPVCCWMLQYLCDYFLSQHSAQVQFVSTHFDCRTNYACLCLQGQICNKDCFNQPRK